MARSWGQQITASAIGEAIKAGAFRSRYNSGFVELKALENLTGVTAPAGGAGLLVPDYVRGILPLLFQPPTVRALILAGTTESVHVGLSGGDAGDQRRRGRRRGRGEAAERAAVRADHR